MYNVKLFRILLGIFLLPLFFINVKDSHDWGDDFAQYLIQTKNMLQGIPQTENGLVFAEDIPAYAINAYPVGLPLLLTPVYWFSGLKILPYCIFNSIILFLTGILCFEFFRKKTTLIFSLLITLLFCYNIQVLELKKQILSELPFTFVLFLLLFSYEHIKNKYFIAVTGLILGMLISIRLAGFSILGAFIVFELFKLKKEIYGRLEYLLLTTMVVVICILFFIVLNQFLFPIGLFQLFGFYMESFQQHEASLINNLKLYYATSNFIFPLFGLMLPALWVLLAVSGWIVKCIQSASFLEFIFPAYTLLILFYPYGDGGARFLIPVLPFLIYYLGYFLKFVLTPIGKKSTGILATIYLMMLAGYAGPVKSLIQNQNKTEEGPQKSTSIEMFEFVKTFPENSVFAFCRARAFALYTGKKALYSTRKETVKETFLHFQKNKNLHLVIPKENINKWLNDFRLKALLENNPNQYQRIWENKDFEIYRQH